MSTRLRLVVTWRLGMPVVSPPSELGCLDRLSPREREPVPDSQRGWPTPASCSHASWKRGGGYRALVWQGAWPELRAALLMSVVLSWCARLRLVEVPARLEMSHPRAPGKGQEARRTPLSSVADNCGQWGFCWPRVERARKEGVGALYCLRPFSPRGAGGSASPQWWSPQIYAFGPR